MSALAVGGEEGKSELTHHLDAVARLLQHTVTAPQSILGLHSALQSLETRMKGVERQLRSRHECTQERGNSALPTIVIIDGSKYPVSTLLHPVTSWLSG